MIPITDIVAAGTPAGWKTVPFWSLFRREKVTGFPDEELLSVYRDYGVIPKSSRDDNHNKASEDLSGYQLVTEGALVTNKMKAWQGSIAISRYQGIVSPAYYVYTPQSDECDQFLHYLLRSDPYIGMYGRISKGVRVNQWDLEHEALRNIPVLLPDLETQRQIADFLDRETARIDLLIEKKQRLVALLGEKENTAICDLLSACSYKAQAAKCSRLPWQLEIPADWQEQPLKQTAEVIDCKHTTPTYVDEGYPLISTGEVKPYSISFVSNRQVSEDDYQNMTEGGRKPKHDDIIYSRNASVGSAAMVRDLEPFCMGQDICLVRPISINPRFLEHQLNSKILHLQLEPLLVGSTLKRINVNQIKNFSIIVPPRDTQHEIATRIDLLRERSHNTICATLQSIDRLKEYCSALITAAVTGQIDVQTYGKSGTVDRRLEAIQEELEA